MQLGSEAKLQAPCHWLFGSSFQPPSVRCDTTPHGRGPGCAHSGGTFRLTRPFGKIVRTGGQLVRGWGVAGMRSVDNTWVI
jgi:hypothetical protein